MTENVTYASDEVLAFYKELPFNYRSTVDGTVKAIKKQNMLKAYPMVAELLSKKTTVLDVGCGAGWLSNSIAHHYGCPVQGIDFNPVAVDRAQDVSKGLRASSEFSVQDLFLYRPEPAFDAVLSLGVLHHTNNCREALKSIATHTVKSGGHIFVGLYHTYGRAPFLQYFENLKANDADENALFEAYKELHSTMTDETQLLSWFRDQVLHPHETQHTLEMVCEVFDECGIDLVSTSINKFQPISSREALYEAEKTYLELGRQKLKEKTYFPGFFVALGKKQERP